MPELQASLPGGHIHANNFALFTMSMMRANCLSFNLKIVWHGLWGWVAGRIGSSRRGEGAVLLIEARWLDFIPVPTRGLSNTLRGIIPKVLILLQRILILSHIENLNPCVLPLPQPRKDHNVMET